MLLTMSYGYIKQVLELVNDASARSIYDYNKVLYKSFVQMGFMPRSQAMTPLGSQSNRGHRQDSYPNSQAPPPPPIFIPVQQQPTVQPSYYADPRTVRSEQKMKVNRQATREVGNFDAERRPSRPAVSEFRPEGVTYTKKREPFAQPPPQNEPQRSTRQGVYYYEEKSPSRVSSQQGDQPSSFNYSTNRQEPQQRSKTQDVSRVRKPSAAEVSVRNQQPQPQSQQPQQSQTRQPSQPISRKLTQNVIPQQSPQPPSEPSENFMQSEASQYNVSACL